MVRVLFLFLLCDFLLFRGVSEVFALQGSILNMFRFGGTKTQQASKSAVTRHRRLHFPTLQAASANTRVAPSVSLCLIV